MGITTSSLPVQSLCLQFQAFAEEGKLWGSPTAVSLSLQALIPLIKSSPEPPFGYNLSAIITGAHPHFRAALIYGKGTRFPYSELMMGIYSPNMFLNGLTERPGWAACMVWAPGRGGVGVGGETALCIPGGRVGSSCITPIYFACSPFLILWKEDMGQALSSSWKEFHFFFSSLPPSFPLSCLHLDPCTWLKKPLTPVLAMEIVYNRKGKLSVSTRPRCLPQKEIQWRREDYWSVDGVLPLSCHFFFLLSSWVSLWTGGKTEILSQPSTPNADCQRPLFWWVEMFSVLGGSAQTESYYRALNFSGAQYWVLGRDEQRAPCQGGSGINESQKLQKGTW